MGGMQIRPFRPTDRDACYDVCVRTGLAGGDATGAYSDDSLTPDIFCGPYLELEPDLAFVIDDGERAVGYVLGAHDTADFVARYRAQWLPGFERRHPLRDDVSADEREMLELGYRPERMLTRDLDEYPAHLHIDLLPSAQGHGLGRALMTTLLEALTRRGIPGVHLEMDPANTGALRFYEKLGFTRLEAEEPDSLRMGLRLPAAS